MSTSERMPEVLDFLEEVTALPIVESERKHIRVFKEEFYIPEGTDLTLGDFATMLFDRAKDYSGDAKTLTLRVEPYTHGTNFELLSPELKPQTDEEYYKYKAEILCRAATNKIQEERRRATLARVREMRKNGMFNRLKEVADND